MAGFRHQVMLCLPQAWEEALEVLYRRVPETLRSRLIAEVLDEVKRGELDLSGLWIAQKRSGQVVGALLTQHLAGRAAAVWAPEVRPMWCRARLAAALVGAALADLKARGFQLAQAVLDESATIEAGRDLNRGGMPRVTELLYLERATSVPLLQPRVAAMRGDHSAWYASSDVFNWRGFEPALEGEFRSVLRATYRGSLDMPELEGNPVARRHHCDSSCCRSLCARALVPGAHSR